MEPTPGSGHSSAQARAVQGKPEDAPAAESATVAEASSNSDPLSYFNYLNYSNWKDFKPPPGLGGFAIGYQARSWDRPKQDPVVTHGIHGDAVFVWSRAMIPFVTPSLTVEADLTFPNVAASAGVGPGLHLMMPGLFQGYGKFMLDGHVASIKDQGTFGWSANAVFGIQILLGYVQGCIPIFSSSDLDPGWGVGGGFRAGF